MQKVIIYKNLKIVVYLHLLKDTKHVICVGNNG